MPLVGSSSDVLVTSSDDAGSLSVDDFHLHETKLKPKGEIFVKDRVNWVSAVEGTQQFEAQGQRPGTDTTEIDTHKTRL